MLWGKQFIFATASQGRDDSLLPLHKLHLDAQTSLASKQIMPRSHSQLFQLWRVSFIHWDNTLKCLPKQHLRRRRSQALRSSRCSVLSASRFLDHSSFLRAYSSSDWTYRLLSSESSHKLVKVHVGPKRKLWDLHEDLLCDRSEYFRSAFQGGFKEATEKQIHLKEEDPEAFALFVDWLYGRTLAPGPNASKNRSDGERFLRLYCLAEFLGIEALMNTAIDTYIASSKTKYFILSTQVIETIYKCTAETSLVRKFVSRTVAYTISTWIDLKDKYDAELKSDPELAVEVIKAMQFYLFCTPLEKIDPKDEPLCNHHLHRHTEKCK